MDSGQKKAAMVLYETTLRKSTNQLVCWIGVLVTGGISLLKELCQLYQSGFSYFKSFQNILELGTYFLSIIFVMDFNPCHADTGLRYGWQWEIGSITITVAWISFLSNFWMVPFLGIYILMITNILKTFGKLAFVVILFVFAFAIGFHCLLAEQANSVVNNVLRKYLEYILISGGICSCWVLHDQDTGHDAW